MVFPSLTVTETEVKPRSSPFLVYKVEPSVPMARTYKPSCTAELIMIPGISLRFHIDFSLVDYPWRMPPT